MSGIERHQHRIQRKSAQCLGHGDPVVVAGYADKTGGLLLLQPLQRREDTIRSTYQLDFLRLIQAVDLNQVEIVGLQILETQFNRAKRLIPLPWLHLGGKKDLLAPRLDEFANRFSLSLSIPRRV